MDSATHPSSPETHRELDAMIIAQLVNAGADLMSSRNIRHFASFIAREQCSRFRAYVEGQGFVVFFHGEGKDQRWELHFQRQGVLSKDYLYPLLDTLDQATEALDGTNEGWDAEVKPEELRTMPSSVPNVPNMPVARVLASSNPPPPSNWSQAALEQRKLAAAAYSRGSQRTHSPAVIALVMAIICAPIGLIGSLIAAIVGHISRNTIRRSRGQLSGDGIATAAIVIGWLGVTGWVLLIAIIGVALLNSATTSSKSFAEERKEFKTTLSRLEHENEAPDPPPRGMFDLVKYPGPLGSMHAYLSSDPNDGKKHPCMVWLVGGFSNSIGDVWSPQPANNDQSASVFRKAGLLMMYPSTRGGNNNPGSKEGLFGEVDDVLAAIRWLASQPYIDSKRIYLGGHSTGGTLCLLVAECQPDVRAVIAFGPVSNILGYGKSLPFSLLSPSEYKMRSPGSWLNEIARPTYVIEAEEGNIHDLRKMKEKNSNPLITFIEIPKEDHFTVLQPVSKVIAKMLIEDTGEQVSIPLTQEAAEAPFRHL